MADEDEADGFPAAADVMFKVRSAKAHRATDEDWYHYTQGYLRAADVLLEHVGGNYLEARKLGAPIIFLYRQHLELTIKCVMRDCQTWLGRPIVIPADHRFEKIWPMCAALINEVFTDYANSEEMQNTTRLLLQFKEVDPNSTVFRYPANKQGNVSLAKVDFVDLRDLSASVAKISLMLECVQAGIDAMNG